MAKNLSLIPERLSNDETQRYLKKFGCGRIHQGKVRDTYRYSKDQLLVVATDRISIFDFVLNAEIPGKGEILTALTHFWLTTGFKKIPNHFVPSIFNKNFNASWDIRETELPDLPIERCLIVKDLTDTMEDFEFIFRHHLGGSVYDTYTKTSKVAGNFVKPNKPKWAKMKTPLFTPSTKAKRGHDINIDTWRYYNKAGENGKKLVALLELMYKKAYRYAEERGILILDTKFEASANVLTIADEILTPDSSRFVYTHDWLIAMEQKKDPPFLDKQVVRDWGANITLPDGNKGIKNLKPTNPEHVKFVHNQELPSSIIRKVQRNYHTLFRILTGMTLKQYQKKQMGV